MERKNKTCQHKICQQILDASKFPPEEEFTFLHLLHHQRPYSRLEDEAHEYFLTQRFPNVVKVYFMVKHLHDVL